MRKLEIKKNILVLIGLFFILVFPTTVKSISVTPSGYDLELTLSPRNPSAYQTITAQVELYGLAIEKFEILWFVDGVLKKKGVGQKEFFFQTKDWGETTNLAVQVNTKNNGQMTKSINLTPAGVDLIWEAHTTTHPFYKGKALNSSNAVIKIVALPNFINHKGVKLASENLLYTWKEDWKTKGTQSGYGKNTYSFEGPQTGRSKRITVTVKSLDGAMHSQKTISLRAKRPQILFYKKDPLLGTLYNQAITSALKLTEKELTISATPFFFSPQDELRYKWTMNGEVLDKDNLELVLRKPTHQTGQSKIDLKINNLDTILQFTEDSFTANFSD